MQRFYRLKTRMFHAGYGKLLTQVSTVGKCEQICMTSGQAGRTNAFVCSINSHRASGRTAIPLICSELYYSTYLTLERTVYYTVEVKEMAVHGFGAEGFKAILFTWLFLQKAKVNFIVRTIPILGSHLVTISCIRCSLHSRNLFCQASFSSLSRPYGQLARSRRQSWLFCLT